MDDMSDILAHFEDMVVEDEEEENMFVATMSQDYLRNSLIENLLYDKNGETILHRAARVLDSSTILKVDLFLDSVDFDNYDIRTEDDERSTSLLLATRAITKMYCSKTFSEYMAIVDVLLTKRGANPYATNLKGESPVQIAHFTKLLPEFLSLVKQRKQRIESKWLPYIQNC